MKKLIFIMLFVVLGVSHGAAENVDVKELYRTESVHNYDLIYNDTLHELTFVYEIRERSGERNITSKKLILQDNKITEQTSSVTTYTFSDIEFLKPHKLNIDQFNNFGEFFFTEVDMNNDGYKERILTNFVPVGGIRYFKMGDITEDSEHYKKFKDYKDKVAIHILIQDGKTKQYVLDKVIHSNDGGFISPYGIVPLQYKDTIMFLILIAYETGVSGWNYYFRLYDNNWNLLFQSTSDFDFYRNIIAPEIIDIDGDGIDEVMLFIHDVGGTPAMRIFQIIKSKDAPRTIYLRPGGDRFYGEDVKFIQRRLLAEGIDIGPDGVDGYYGPDTRNGIIEFQKRKELLVTGVVDKATWEALNKEKKE